MNLDRRQLICSSVAVAGSLTMPRAFAQDVMQSDPPPVTEYQRGDPSMLREAMSYYPERVRGIIDTARANYTPRIPRFSNTLLGNAQAFIGVSRQGNQQQVSDFLELFGLPYAIGGNPLAFCASGISYCAALAYARTSSHKQSFGRSELFPALQSTLGDVDHHHFYPSPSVADMYNVALGKRRWSRRGSTLPRPGWLVIYDWDQNGGTDHVGVVESADRQSLHTIEFNTSGTYQGNQINGGAVFRKTRPLNGTVKGYIRTDASTLV